MTRYTGFQCNSTGSIQSLMTYFELYICIYNLNVIKPWDLINLQETEDRTCFVLLMPKGCNQRNSKLWKIPQNKQSSFCNRKWRERPISRDMSQMHCTACLSCDSNKLPIEKHWSYQRNFNIDFIFGHVMSFFLFCSSAVVVLWLCIFLKFLSFND